MFSIDEEESGEVTGLGADHGPCGTAAELINLLVSGADAENTEAILTGLRHLFPHEFFAIAQLNGCDGRMLRVVNFSFPPDELESFGIVSESRDSLLVKEWFAHRAPVCIDAGGVVLAEREWPAAALGHPTLALLFHAQLDPTGVRGMGFCFGSVPREALQCCGAVLRFVTPYLYARLARNFWSPLSANAARLLTPREIQVIEWMYYGKTNEEIATLLGNSVYTVKNHVQRILLKLSATNRTQAVLRAVDAGLVKYSDSSDLRLD